MFPEPDPSPVRLSGNFDSWAGLKAGYTDYHTKKRVQCDECVWTLHLAGGIGDPPRTARHRRTCEAGTLVLCYAHTTLWKELDGK